MNSTLALSSGLGLGLGLETSGLGLGLGLGLETPGLVNIPDKMRRTREHSVVLACVMSLIQTFCTDEEVCLLLCMEGSLFCFRQ